MTHEDFKNWRNKMGPTQQQAADVLGLSKATIENYDKGVRREDGRPVVIPRVVALACAAIEHKLAPFGGL